MWSKVSRFSSFSIRRNFAQISTPRTPTYFKRFYKDVSVREVAQDSAKRFEILLDGKMLRTPARNVLTTSNEALAYAIAAEWDAQGEHVRPVCMPLMALMSSTMDLVSADRDAALDNAFSFLSMDSSLFRTPNEIELLERQEKIFGPIVNWFEVNYGPVEVTTSLAPPVVSDISRIKSFDALNEMSDAELTAISVAASNTKSFITALALIRNMISPEQALQATLLEENYQRDQWGRAEGDHDVDQAACSVQLHATQLFAQLSRMN